MPNSISPLFKFKLINKTQKDYKNWNTLLCFYKVDEDKKLCFQAKDSGKGEALFAAGYQCKKCSRPEDV